MSDGSSGESAGAPPGAGFFGKLPSHGDFVSRRLPPDFLTEWEAWLNGGLDRSRAMLGEAWLTTYLACPIWRFIASPRCCGDSGFAGILMPSLDRVGRYYPLSIIALFLAPAAVFHAEADLKAAELCSRVLGGDAAQGVSSDRATERSRRRRAP